VHQVIWDTLKLVSLHFQPEVSDKVVRNGVDYQPKQPVTNLLRLFKFAIVRGISVMLLKERLTVGLEGTGVSKFGSNENFGSVTDCTYELLGLVASREYLLELLLSCCN
jgi:hypothetical protein